MRITVGIQQSKLETDNPKLFKALQNIYTFKVPGASYSPQYRAGRWDGKKRFITNAGKFRSGLLDSVLKTLEKIECFPEIVIESPKDNSNTKKLRNIEGFTYYKYQKELIQEAIQEGRGVIKSPTGSGKTLIMTGLLKSIYEPGMKVVLLVNSKQLLHQNYEFLTECGFTVGRCSGEGYEYGDIMICTVQSIEKIIDTHLDETEILLVDECHEFCSGDTTVAAIQAFPNAQWRFGFTATPPPDEIPLHNLLGAFGKILESVNTSELVEEGTLAKPHISIIEREYTASSNDIDMSYLEVYDNYIVNNEERNEIIVNLVRRIAKNGRRNRILILTKQLDHGRLLEENLAEFRAEFLEGADSLGERYKSINRFTTQDRSSVLIGTKILQTGVNIREITHFINARGMKSEIATIQALGRALRTHEDKDEVYVYDFKDKEKYLLQHSNKRIKHYKNEGHLVEIFDEESYRSET